MSTEQKPPPPIPDEMLEKSIALLEGPANRFAERVLSSTLVLAPLSFSLGIGLRAMATLRDLRPTTTPHTGRKP